MTKINYLAFCFTAFLLLLPAPAFAQGNATESRNADFTTTVFAQYVNNDGTGQYFFMLSTGDYSFDEDRRVYFTTGKGEMLTVTLYGEPSGGTGTMIPEGTYTMGAGTGKGTWYDMQGMNRIVINDGADALRLLTPSEGSMTVTHNGGSTCITGSLTVEGMAYTFSFNGEIPFGGNDTDGKIHDDIITTFTGGTAIHRDMMQGMSVIELQLYDSETGEGGEIMNGNIVKAQFCAAAYNYSGGGFASVPAGRYTMGSGYTPGMLVPGYDDGVNMPTGSYAAHTESGRGLLGMINAGSMDVSDLGNGKYSVTVDMTTEEGAAVKGTFTGEFEYIDLVGGGPSWLSNITEDKTISYPGITRIDCNDIGDFYSNGTRVVEFTWRDETTMTGTILELVLPAAGKGAPIPTGTYTITEGQAYKAGTCSPGIIMNNYLLGTWGFVKLGRDDSGAIGIDGSEIGCAATGNVTVDYAGGKYTFTFDLLDDTPGNSHSMKGSWTGTVANLSLPDNITQPCNTDGDSSPVYNMQGMAMGRNTSELPAGIYLKGRKKVVVK